MKAFHEVRNYISDFMVWHGRYTNISFIAHWHREIELIYVDSGCAEIHVTDDTIHAKTGDLVICDSGDIHYCNTHTEDSVLDFLLFDTGILSSQYQYHSFMSHLVSKKDMDRSGLSVILSVLLHTIDEELSARHLFYQDIIRSDIRSFWCRMLRILPCSSTATAMQDRRKNMLSDFQSLLTFLEDHCNGDITLDDAAEMMNFSPSHFSKLFKQLTGSGFVRYLNIIRISKAAELLTTTDDRIIDISLMCGFSSIRTFNRVFTGLTGYTPSAYRKQPEKRSYNFTYYHSSADLLTRPEFNPTIR